MPLKVVWKAAHDQPYITLNIDEDSGKLYAQNSQGVRLDDIPENAEELSFDKSVTDRLKHLYDIAEDRGLIKDKDAGILVKINARGKNDFELIVKSGIDEQGNTTTSATYVTENFIKNNPQARDNAREQSPENYGERRNGLRYKHIPENEAEKIKLSEAMDKDDTLKGSPSSDDSVTPLNQIDQFKPTG